MGISKELPILYKVVVALFVISIGYSDSMANSKNDGENNRVLKTVLERADDISNYDPTRILIYAEYMLLDAMYTSLLRYDENNNLVTEAAKKFYWENSNLVFELRKDLRFSDGSPITPEDVKASIIRLQILQEKTTHSFISDLLKGNLPKSIDENTGGITTTDNKIIFSFKNKYPSALSLFSNIEFAILPKKVINRNTLKIENYEITSGPYYYQGKGKDGQLVLIRNPYFTDFEKTSPSAIYVYEDQPIKGSGSNVVQLFQSGKINHINTSNRVSSKDQKLLDNSPGVSSHKTTEIKVGFIAFTDKGMLISSEKRRQIAKVLRTVLKKFQNEAERLRGVPEGYFSNRKEFFIPGSYGSLDEDQLEKISEGMKKVKEILPRKIKIGISEGQERLFDMESKFAKNIEFVYREKFKTTNFAEMDINHTDMPDLVVLSQDLAFNEDLGFLTFTLNFNVFPVRRQEEIRAWVFNYLNTDSSKEKIKLIRDLHYKAVFEDISLIPLFSSPFSAYTKKGWDMKFSRYDSLNPFWKVVGVE